MNKKMVRLILGFVLMITALPLLAACGKEENEPSRDAHFVLNSVQDPTDVAAVRNALEKEGVSSDDAEKLANSISTTLKNAPDRATELTNINSRLLALRKNASVYLVNQTITNEAKPDTSLGNTKEHLVQGAPTVAPTPTTKPTVAPQATPTATPASTNPPIKGTTSPSDIAKIFKLDTAVANNCWTISADKKRYDDPENKNIKAWVARLGCADPANWKTFPNIRNLDVPAFPTKNCHPFTNADGQPDTKCEVPAGVSYGTYSTPFCQQDMRCDYPVGALEYRLYTGDYSFVYDGKYYSCEGVNKGPDAHGCLLLVLNMMDESYIWRDQTFDNGFTLRGVIFDSTSLEWGVVGLVSHASANMLNMPTFAHPGEVLNTGKIGNSGANCGNPLGCGYVDVLVLGTTGEFVNLALHTKVTPNGGTK